MDLNVIWKLKHRQIYLFLWIGVNDWYFIVIYMLKFNLLKLHIYSFWPVAIANGLS